MIKILIIFTILSSVHSLFYLCQQCRRLGGNQTTSGDGGVIGCTIDRNICKFNESSEPGGPESPTQQHYYDYNMPYIKSADEDGVVLDFNVTFSPPQNSLITWVDGFKLSFGYTNQSINICLGRQLNYKDDAAMLLNFDCFTEFTDEKFLPERDDYNVSVQTIYRENLSDPILYKLLPISCKNKQLQNSSMCERPVEPKSEATVTQLSTFPLAVLAAVPFILLFILLVVTTIYKRPKFMVKMLKRHQGLPDTQENQQAYTNTAPSHIVASRDEPATEKPVLIYVCDGERSEVETFVVYLINFLRRDLHVDAECNLFDEDAEQNYSRWLENTLKEDKKVLVIWSPLSKARWLKKGSYDPFLPLLYQMKTQMILNPKYTQLASATFNCLQGDQCVPDVFRNYTPIFYLPENIELLYFWLQGKEMFEPGQEMIVTPLNDENYKDTEYGPRLKTSYDALVSQSGMVMEWYEENTASLLDESDTEKGDSSDDKSSVSTSTSKPSMSTYYASESQFGPTTENSALPLTIDESTIYHSESSSNDDSYSSTSSPISSSDDDDDDVGSCTGDGMCAHCTKIRMDEERAMGTYHDSIHFERSHCSDIAIPVDSSDDESPSVQVFDFSEKDLLC